jgi:hypothetical protein
VKHPKTPPYTPEELPPIRDEHSKMVYIWVTAYTINTAFFAVNQSGLQFLFDNDNVRMMKFYDLLYCFQFWIVRIRGGLGVQILQTLTMRNSI